MPLLKEIAEKKQIVQFNDECLECGKDAWLVSNGYSPEYKTNIQTGHYVRFTCSACGYFHDVIEESKR